MEPRGQTSSSQASQTAQTAPLMVPGSRHRPSVSSVDAEGDVISVSSVSSANKVRYYRYGSVSSTTDSLPALPPMPNFSPLKKPSAPINETDRLLKHPSVDELVQRASAVTIGAPIRPHTKAPSIHSTLAEVASVHSHGSEDSAVLSVTYSIESPTRRESDSQAPDTTLVGGLSYASSTADTNVSQPTTSGRRNGNQAKAWLPQLKTPAGAVSSKNYKPMSSTSASIDLTSPVTPGGAQAGNLSISESEISSLPINSGFSGISVGSKTRHNSGLSATGPDATELRLQALGSITASGNTSQKYQKSILSSSSVLVHSIDERKSSNGSAPRNGSIGGSAKDDATATESIRTSGRRGAFFNRGTNDSEVCSPMGLYCHVPNIYGAEPPHLAGHCNCILKNKIYIYGGRTASSVSNKLYIFDCVTMSLTECTIRFDNGKRPPPKLADAASAVVGHLIYIYGGIDENGTYCNDLYCLDSRTLVMRMIPASSGDPLEKVHVPMARRGHSLVASSETLYIFGGIQENNTTLSDIWKVKVNGLLMPKETVYVEVNLLEKDTPGLWPAPRAFHSAHLVDGEGAILIYGGSGTANSTKSKVYGDVWFFNIAEQHWSQMPPGVEKKSQRYPPKRWLEPVEWRRTLHASCMIGDTLVVVGGHDGHSLISTIATLYLPEHRWKISHINGVQFPGQCYHGVLYYDSRLFITGGLGPTEFFAGMRLVEVPMGSFLESPSLDFSFQQRMEEAAIVQANGDADRTPMAVSRDVSPTRL